MAADGPEPLVRPSLSQLKERCLKTIEAPDSRVLYRPISIRLTWLLMRTPLTPNGATTLGLLSALTGLGLMVWYEAWWPLLGVALLELAIVFDHVDGEIARAKALSSPGGHFYDSAVLEISVNLSLFAALGWVVWRQTDDAAWVVLGSVLFFLKAINVGITQYRGVLTERDARRRLAVPEDARPADRTPPAPPSLTGRVAGLVWGVKNAINVTFFAVLLDLWLSTAGYLPYETGRLTMTVTGGWVLFATVVLLATDLRDLAAGARGRYQVDFPKFR